MFLPSFPLPFRQRNHCNRVKTLSIDWPDMGILEKEWKYVQLYNMCLKLFVDQNYYYCCPP